MAPTTVIAARQLTKNFTKSLVRIVVGSGPDQEEFQVHKQLCVKVPYFDKALNSGFRESKEEEIHFPEDDPEAFNLLIMFLYAGTLEPAGDVDSNFAVYVRLYLLADKLQWFDLQDATMVQIQEAMRNTQQFPKASIISHIYERTTSESKVRELMVSAVAHKIKHGPWEGNNFWKTHYATLDEEVPAFGLEVLSGMHEVMRDRYHMRPDPSSDTKRFKVVRKGTAPSPPVDEAKPERATKKRKS